MEQRPQHVKVLIWRGATLLGVRPFFVKATTEPAFLMSAAFQAIESTTSISSHLRASMLRQGESANPSAVLKIHA